MNKTVFCNREFYLSRSKHIPDRHERSIILLWHWLVLKTLRISTWFCMKLVNYIRFNLIIVGFFILTKLLAYNFFRKDISPSLIFVIQKHLTIFTRKISTFFGRYVCCSGVSQRYQQNWNVCIIIIIIVIITISFVSILFVNVYTVLYPLNWSTITFLVFNFGLFHSYDYHF